MSINPFRFLSDDFVQKSILDSGLDTALEVTKSTAIEASVGIFNPDESRDIPISLKYPDIKFSQLFSQERLGAGATKGMAGIISALVECAKLKISKKSLSDKQSEFIEKTYEVAESIFDRLNNGDTKMQDLRNLSRDLDNFGGSYQAIELNISNLDALADIPSTYSLAIDQKSGHLVGVSPVNVSEKMWSVKPVMDFMANGLNECGQLKLMRPYSESFVVVAYKHEIQDMDQVNRIINETKTIECSPERIYKVPVRGDNRYEEIMAVKLSPNAITETRAQLGLQPFPVELPPRFTFGAVLTCPAKIQSLEEYMDVSGLKKYQDILSSQLEAHLKQKQFV